MRKSILIVCASVLTFMATSCKDKAVDKVNAENVEAAAARDANANKFGEMKFEETTHDFGNVQSGVKQFYSFKFTNTGEVPLVITSAKGSCGCTVPEVPKEPIKPGEQGELKVNFDPSGSGQTEKTVTIKANTKTGTEIVRIQAYIEPKVAK